MRKLFAILSVVCALAVTGCSSFKKEIDELYDQAEEIKKSEAEIQARLDDMNSSIVSLNKLIVTLQSGGYVKSVIPFNDEYGNEAGYILTLNTGESITIHNGKDGADGVVPNVGAKRDSDGLYYWTVDGEFVLDSNGLKIRADGVTPTFEIRDGYWYISYDNGTSWTQLGRATGTAGADGAPGDQLFKSIEYTSGSNAVTITLADGTKLVLPCYQAIAISFDIENNVTAIAAGETIKVNYTLSYGDDNTMVTASSDGNYKVKVIKTSNTTGYIMITCPGLYVDGHVNVMAFDGVGYASVSVINFYEKQILITGDLTFYLATEGGSISVPISYNTDYYAEVSKGDEDWITIVQTKASDYKSGTLKAQIAKNEGDSRIGYIYLYTSNTTGTPYATIEIHQEAAYFSISPTSFLFTAEGGSGISYVQTSRGLTVKSSADWVKAEVETISADRSYHINITADANSNQSTRYAYVYVYSGSGSSQLATIDVIEMASGTEKQLDMVFEAKPSISNNYTVYLPINRTNGTVECAVDWGDGTVETIQYGTDSVQGNNVYHKYTGITASSTIVTITVSGKLSTLDAQQIPEGLRSGITAVKQWGNTGLTNMSNAFNSFTSLESLPEDKCLAFREVTDFYYAFANCPRLKTIDKNLFAYASNATSFSEIFRNCYSLESIPEGLFKPCVKAQSFNWAFYNCRSLKSVPASLFSGLSAVTSFSYTFYNCKSITAISASAFEGCTGVQNLERIFQECNSLESIPSGLFSAFTKATSFEGIFSSCTSLAAIPSDLFTNCKALQSLSYAFNNTAITSIPSNLLSNCTELSNVSGTFESCSQLKTIPTGIFDNNRRITNFNYTFGWSNWQMTGESPYTVINGKKVHLYERINYPDYFVTPVNTSYCFGNLQHLTDYEQIPDSWKN